jgi:hypothetical protein
MDFASDAQGTSKIIFYSDPRYPTIIAKKSTSQVEIASGINATFQKQYDDQNEYWTWTRE